MASQAQEAEVTSKTVAAALTELNAGLNKLLDDAKKGLEECSGLDFVINKVGDLSNSCILYYSAYQQMGVKSRAEMDDIIKKHIKSQEVDESFEDLMETEQTWNRFAGDIDNKLGDRYLPKTKIDDTMLDVPLVNARTGAPTTLRQNLVEKEYTIVTAVRHTM